MLVYIEDKKTFNEDVFENNIEEKILGLMKKKLGKRVSPNEIRSWKYSLGYMDRILNNPSIPDNAGIAIEYGIPQTSKRVDFIVTGTDEVGQQTAIIIELKQWEKVEITTKDAIVSTYLGGGTRETSHPSYQAWSYASLLLDFNEEARAEDVTLYPCAYLHNCKSGEVINDAFYRAHTEKAPAFLKSDASKLRNFISQYVKFGDAGELMYRIRDGKISPSKNLADKLASLLEGNKEFLMIDDQKLVYETAIHLGDKATEDSKEVFIVEGGPGTGKSVVAINLLVDLIGKKKNTKYVTKNAAPRTVYESKLLGSMKKTEISNLFTGSGTFTLTPKSTFDTLIVDEAHRLNAKSGMFQNKGENQIKEIIHASNCSIFFIDEDQRVHFKDIGTIDAIKKWAELQNANVTEMKLESQFRCNGSDGYLAWVDNTLQIKETVNETLQDIDYEFAICETPNELQEKIFALNKLNNKARIVAGYCWKWAGKKEKTIKDIVIAKYNFAARWNLADDGNLWILKEESVNEIGCIHTCQGLELDYIGVVIGPDLIVRDGEVLTDGNERASSDASMKGFKKLFKTSPEEAIVKADMIIKNTYRTLMTRGQKGCFVFSTDPETNEYLQYSSGKVL
ncbi:MAG: DUF2075 domain-containing protein [Planctomycetes bacterium]|nr:DUF2075 domain-containing protein [Planctomycetota bacterium]